MGMTKTSAHRRPFTPLPTLGRDAAKVSNEPIVSNAAHCIKGQIVQQTVVGSSSRKTNAEKRQRPSVA